MRTEQAISSQGLLLTESAFPLQVLQKLFSTPPGGGVPHPYLPPPPVWAQTKPSGRFEDLMWTPMMYLSTAHISSGTLLAAPSVSLSTESSQHVRPGAPGLGIRALVTVHSPKCPGSPGCMTHGCATYTESRGPQAASELAPWELPRCWFCVDSLFNVYQSSH